MKFIAVKENFKDGVLLVEKNTGRKTTLPILSTILCSAEKGKITLTATNLETAVEVWVGGKVEQEGRIAIPARVLSSYISLVGGEHITCSVKNGNIELVSTAGRTIIHGQAADDFPLVPQQTESESFTISGPVLQASLQHVVSASSLSDIKPEIASVYVYLTHQKAIFAATDSFRLAEQQVDGVFGEKGWSQSFLLPIRSIHELTHLLDREDGNVAVSLGVGQVVFQTKRFRMVSRLVEGSFPDYQRIVPTAFTTEFTLSKDVLVDMLRVAGVFVGKLSDITFHVNPQDKKIEIRAQNADVGENQVYANTPIIGKEMSITFNYRYIMDGLQNMSGDVFFGFASPEGPLLMRSKDDSSYFYIVMPMKI
ncbi:MAG: DNA polymerase III subunit beta [Candidatus Ryanbacteria bacterium RIFCSPHIGHO2_02_FULL_45_17b]|uniref:Beta sliding clamp n=1 Tax=Candidatus Ryanbacteria bacterium RIFCSPHIGHO2_01_FULL_45_22 TaxID=1802114 RepID=A0A1G2G208_9BACT|nr:MAG: DNA polymerase III subunit beta [Candidatus Ryanbacteria bacterium RIFCSPHIGHO2_01_FULL_45_22]OGZ47507.1 MAG: DNA polymerase III subunit beta [Candidatus Ryanbacteria bacterium RIFCSPHIGHO2_02_FULL_45_17b]